MSIPIKSAKDVEKMRVACRTASDILEQVAGFLRPGVTTGEVDQYAGELMRAAQCTSAFFGYRGNAARTPFPGQICISLNEEVVHGFGGPRRIQYGDVVKLDIGVLKGGWYGDTAKTVAVGIVEPEVRRLLQVTEEALELSIPEAREGRRLHDLSGAIEDHVVKNGFRVVREFVGHGVGRKLHEEPQVPNCRTGANPKLRAGMTLAVEPMVNLGRAEVRVLNDQWTVVTSDGKTSAHFEHTVLITGGEPEVLTWRAPTLSR